MYQGIRPNFKGQRWPRLDKTFKGYLCLGNGTQYRLFFIIAEDGYFVVSLYRVSKKRRTKTVIYNKESSPTSWQYVQHDFNLRFESDAKNVTDFINEQLNAEYIEHGSYEKQFCN